VISSQQSPPKRPSGRAKVAVKRRFLREFIARPGVIGAVAPSSVHLARRMVEGLDLGRADAVVEFGPGSGVFTAQILPRLGRQTRFFAIERNAAMAALVRDQFPGVTVLEEDAANVDRLCARQGIGIDGEGGVDYILSGLPWPSFSDRLRTDILTAAHRALKPGGMLITFGYHIGLTMRGAWHFRREARRMFSSMTISPVVWRNIPPAFIYRCTK
jgi:phosphatidylethanolamine/phosphatidyl-N-methylethanolamine N-methyltransferase